MLWQASTGGSKKKKHKMPDVAHMRKEAGLASQYNTTPHSPFAFFLTLPFELLLHAGSMAFNPE